ncbi:FHA domain-containing protein [Agromyces humatus]|uniref:FHA domain-containing protein n=1 Tax=Agromyces humatus TaxID=279573 RepID=A0ABP4WQ16_9MICO|nr:FHA domain-containing protein [Agromyces humatus]
MSPVPSSIRRGFIVEAGGEVNSIIPIPSAVSTVGRDPGADLCLPYDGVSRQHFRIDGTGPAVFVADAQSTNGTWVNDRREAGWTQLRDGDRVKLGSVQLRYFDVASAMPPGMPPTDGYQVTQPHPGATGDDSDAMGIRIGKNNRVSGNGRQNFVDGDQVGRDKIGGDRIGRDQYNSAVNQTWKQKVKISADYEPTDELFNGEGPGRVIAILGGLIALGGFAWFASHIFGAMTATNTGGFGPPPTIGYAFAMFGIGAVLFAIGTGMSKARRKRNGR